MLSIDLELYRINSMYGMNDPGHQLVKLNLLNLLYKMVGGAGFEPT